MTTGGMSGGWVRRQSKSVGFCVVTMTGPVTNLSHGFSISFTTFSENIGLCFICCVVRGVERVDSIGLD